MILIGMRKCVWSDRYKMKTPCLLFRLISILIIEMVLREFLYLVDMNDPLNSFIRFYIRSTLHPKFYWYFNHTNRRVELSKTNQTKFTITRTSTPPQFASTPTTRTEEDILIGEDMVALSVGINGQRVDIVRSPENTMIPRNQPGPFQFSMFEQGFYGLYGQAEGLVCTTGNGDDEGERWEFVA